ncbi:integrating conjugative element protein PilL, PFGI-1 class [Legionella busanensis]|uniref:Integrating conjugative element protein PilL, PFGI-1 class n=1 Tax=Legionella busanensis TaxID=190655 RepID=A0A378KB52_9GAMM|nr:integrating conjugative element protein PilL, PFGI-1 class [Legionella busanensis]
MKKVHDFKKRLFIGLMVAYLGELSAQDVTPIGRYTTVNNKPLAAQVNPLLAIQQVHFNTEIHTVGEALHQWLSLSGYDLAPEQEQSLALKAVLQKPLPQIDRDLGPLTIQEGLEVLVGKGIFKVVVDPLNRSVGFTLSPKYAQFQKKSGAHA